MEQGTEEKKIDNAMVKATGSFSEETNSIQAFVTKVLCVASQNI